MNISYTLKHTCLVNWITRVIFVWNSLILSQNRLYWSTKEVRLAHALSESDTIIMPTNQNHKNTDHNGNIWSQKDVATPSIQPNKSRRYDVREQTSFRRCTMVFWRRDQKVTFIRRHKDVFVPAGISLIWCAYFSLLYSLTPGVSGQVALAAPVALIALVIYHLTIHTRDPSHSSPLESSARFYTEIVPPRLASWSRHHL